MNFVGSEANWGYQGFNKMRERLAVKIGINLRQMDGFGGDISWDGIEDDVLPLLNHSDCDGSISYKDCARVAKRLKVLIKDWDKYEYDTVNMKILIKTMGLCHKKKTNLMFC